MKCPQCKIQDRVEYANLQHEAKCSNCNYYGIFDNFLFALVEVDHRSNKAKIYGCGSDYDQCVEDAKWSNYIDIDLATAELYPITTALFDIVAKFDYEEIVAINRDKGIIE